MYLAFDLKCNLDALDAKKNNALHIAIQTENIDLIKKLVHIDSDHGHMRAHKNANNVTPVEMAGARYSDYLITIWDRVKQGNIHKIRDLVQSNNLITNVHISRRTTVYHINMQTYSLLNTPLHIALMTGSANTIKTVLELGGDPLIKNSNGENAFDLAEKLDASPYIVKLLKRGLIQ